MSVSWPVWKIPGKTDGNETCPLARPGKRKNRRPQLSVIFLQTEWRQLTYRWVSRPVINATDRRACRRLSAGDGYQRLGACNDNARNVSEVALGLQG
ncbi:hypothetical protein BaRGS_00039380 [Batillaria attramentaria]|uniref:Uncharacterized protein n=1 Tax=Batillaria attramentaria TaxID=370345 RepID=A0ABD0J370_9CAEN